MHPPLTLHRHPMCAENCMQKWSLENERINLQLQLASVMEYKEIIEQFQKCHLDHPIGKFFGECTELKVKLDRCFREEKAVKRKANFEQSKKLRERLQAYRKETAETGQ